MYENPTAAPAGPAPLLSLAMIVRDGGQNLSCLLAGARPWVDEMVVADTGSSDGSDEVARGLGARVFAVPWEDDFASARNAVLERCRGRWIVVLDADEQFASADWQELRSWITEPGQAGRPRAGRMATRNYQRDRYGQRGWTPVPEPDPHALPSGPPAEGYVATEKVRVFPNRPEIRFRGELHETVESSLWEAHVPVEDLPWPIHHFGYLKPDPGKLRNYLKLAQRKTTSQPHDARAWAELADCALALGDHQRALVAIDRALVLDPTDPGRHLTAGWLLLEAGDLERAEVHLAAVTGFPGVETHLLAEAAHLRAQVALRRERPKAAAPLLGIALRLYPDNGHFQNTLGSLNLMLGRVADARRAFERACDLLPYAPAPCLNMALLLTNLGDEDGAEVWSAEAGRRDPSCATRHEKTPAPLVGVRG